MSNIFDTPPGVAPLSGNRFDGKNFFITASDLSWTPQELANWQQKLKDLDSAMRSCCSEFGAPNVLWSILALEQHVSGRPHVHAAIAFSSPCRLRSMDLWDSAFQQHPNIQVMKKPVKCVEYVIKEGNYVANGIDPVEFCAGRSTKCQKIAQMVMDGKTFLELVEEDAGYVMLHGQAIEDLSIVTGKHSCLP